MLRLAQISLGTVGMLDRRLRARRGAVVIPVRISIRSGHGRTEPDVSRLLRHRVQILRMPRILVALRVRRLMLVIWLIAIHGGKMRQFRSMRQTSKLKF
jgi:hypothetical protein